MYSAISANKRNTAIIMAVFLLIITAFGFLAGYIWDNSVIAVIFIAVGLGYALIEYFVAGRMAITMSGGREIQKSDCPELWNAVENLSIADGMPMPRVFIIDDQAPNAFATGRDPEHAYVAATTGLLQIMDKRELTAVMAHEMSHVKNYDIRVSMIVFGLVSAIGLIADMFLRMSWFGGSSRDDDDNDNGSIMMAFGIIAASLAPIVACLIRLAVSRQREYLADASGALLTRDPEGLASALQKLETAGRPMRRQSTSTAHLFFNNPLKPGFFSRIMSTHPSLEDRIARLRNNENRM